MGLADPPGENTIATVTVVVTSSTHPAVPVGSVHTYTFFDTGEGSSAIGPDYFLYGANDPHHFEAVAGNIQIHLS